MNEKGKSTLEKFKRILQLKNYSQNTIGIYIHYAKEFILSFEKPANHINNSDIKMYIENYQFTSISQQNQIYSAIKLFAKYILRKKLTGVILERPRKEKKLPQIIEHQYIIDQLGKISNLKHKAIISLAYSGALRVSEVINLKMKDIDRKRMIIHIRNAKGRKDRIIPLSPVILQLLEDYYVEFKPVIYLFNGQNNIRYSAGSCNKIVKKYIGPDYHFHMLRHSSATQLYENGTDVYLIQKLLGHLNIKTTEIYTQVSIRTLSNARLPV